MVLTEAERDRAERLARDVVARVARRPDERLCRCVLHVPPDLPADGIRAAFESSLADAGIELVDIDVASAPVLGIGRLTFERP
jgi:hypothetical protein